MIKLKDLLKLEVTQKDLKANHPHNTSMDMSNLTLDNLKALKDKAYRFWRAAMNGDDREQAMQQYNMYNDEIKSRLAYINQPVNESIHQGNGWFVHEGTQHISAIFENGKQLSFELTFRDKMGDEKDKWRKQAASKWASIARETYRSPELNEIGNPKQLSWEECFISALNDDRLKPYIKPTDRTPVFCDPVNFTPRI